MVSTGGIGTFFISVCVAQIYIKIWKKINANNKFAATNVAIAA